MRSSYNVLFLGLWLMGQCWVSGEGSYSKPSISVYPSETVDLGGTVNISCKSDYQTLPEGPQMEFHLQKQTTSDFEVWRTEVAEHDEVVFPIVSATPSDAGLYRCVYCFKRHNCQGWSHYSDLINIRVRDAGPFHHKPSISEDLTLHEGPSGGDINESVQPVGTYIRLGAASVVLLALVFIVAEAVYSWRNV